MTDNPGNLRIDLDAVLRTRIPRYYKFIPAFLIRQLERFICQREMNEFLHLYGHMRDAEFCRAIINHLGITYTVNGAGNLPDNPRVIISCNHPLGGLDGIILIDYFTQHYGPSVRFVVNDLLMAVTPLSGVFLPINKHGHQSRQSSLNIDNAMNGDSPIIIFPAGLVSRKGKNGIIADLTWQKTFINKAIRHRRDIIPVYFSGQNSKFFYNFAKLRTRLGIKFNIEMTRLPREVFLCRGKSYRISIGRPVSWQSFKGGTEAAAEALFMRQQTYALGDTGIQSPQ